MPSLTVENYLKTILLLERPPEGGPGTGKPVPTGKIAEALGVAPPTVTSMLKSLDAEGLVQYRPYLGVQLRPRGRAIALRILRRHRLVELFLVKVLGMSWSEVHQEAEHLEHAISDRVLERLDHFLGHPSVDPHGDPIPGAAGELPREELVPLAELAAGDRRIISRLLDQSPEFLEMAARIQLLPGSLVEVKERDDALEILRLRLDGEEVTISMSVAGKIGVTGDTPRPARRHRR